MDIVPAPGDIVGALAAPEGGELVVEDVGAADRAAEAFEPSDAFAVMVEMKLIVVVGEVDEGFIVGEVQAGVGADLDGVADSGVKFGVVGGIDDRLAGRRLQTGVKDGEDREGDGLRQQAGDLGGGEADLGEDAFAGGVVVDIDLATAEGIAALAGVNTIGVAELVGKSEVAAELVFEQGLGEGLTDVHAGLSRCLSLLPPGGVSARGTYKEEVTAHDAQLGARINKNPRNIAGVCRCLSD